MPKVKKVQLIYGSLVFVLMVCWLGSRSPDELSNPDHSPINTDQYSSASQDDDASSAPRSSDPRVFKSSKKSLSSGGGRRRRHQPQDDPACGYYQNCPALKPDLINVHFVLHSHNDPGYLKTTEQYFWGTHIPGMKTNHDDAHVEKIISNVVHELQLNKDRKYMYVEMIYFSKWWAYQTEETKAIVKELIRNGQLELVNGGWCENDEATTHYADIIDQMTLGLRFINETFGKCARPKITSHLDSFGNSREQAALYAQMGYDAVMLGRIDIMERSVRSPNKSLEFLWTGNKHLGADGELFSSVMFNIFNPPKTFCFDNFCGDAEHSPPVNDDPSSSDYNVDQRVGDMIAYSKTQSVNYATNNILIFLGSDFTYNNAEVWFSNIDKLIKYANEQQRNGSNFNFLYSTPSCYFKALNDAKKSDWPTKDDDMLPLSYGDHIFWTGYFSSRPSFKYMIRHGSNILRGCKQMASLLKLKNAPNSGNLNVMREAMALMQHHDAIPGTAKQHVIDDYYLRLDIGVEECKKTQSSYYEKVLPLGEDVKLPKVSYCQLNISQCEVTESSTSAFVVNVYNSLPRTIGKYVRFPVSSKPASFLVRDPEGKVVPSQLVPIPPFVLSLPGRNSPAERELVFMASDLPPMGSRSFYVNPVDPAKEEGAATDSEVRIRPENSTLNERVSSDTISVGVDGKTGLLRSFKMVDDEIQMRLEQNVLWYPATRGNSCFTDLIASGFYMFHPLNTSNATTVSGQPSYTIYDGELVQEIHQIVGDWVGQVVRLYKGQDYLEIDWVVGPVPIEDELSKEVVSRFTTNLLNKGDFYTDVNAHQTVKRKRNVQGAGYKNAGKEPVASNYHALTSHIFINDTAGTHLAVILDRAQGGGSIFEGELEMMIHRRLLSQDLCQMNETHNETAYDKGLAIRGTYHVIMTSSINDTSFKPIKVRSQELYMHPQISFIATNLDFKTWSSRYKNQHALLNRSLPENVNILTLEPLSDGRYLFRLEHLFDLGEHAVQSTPVTVSLKGLFAGFDVVSMEETTLDGNMLRKDVNRKPWRKPVPASTIKPFSIENISLNPLEIRTFILEVSEKP